MRLCLLKFAIWQTNVDELLSDSSRNMSEGANICRNAYEHYEHFLKNPEEILFPEALKSFDPVLGPHPRRHLVEETLQRRLSLARSAGLESPQLRADVRADVCSDVSAHSRAPMFFF